MDAAVEEYKKETNHTEPEVTSTFEENGTFREDGWFIRRSLDLEE